MRTLLLLLVYAGLCVFGSRAEDEKPVLESAGGEEEAISPMPAESAQVRSPPGEVSGDMKPETEKQFAAPRIRVIKNNVNLRAKPSLTSETVGQVSEGCELESKRHEGEWVEVVPPSSFSVWVLGDYVKGGLIEGDNVNVRAGAGISFSIVGQLERGAAVDVRGAMGPWVSIEPPQSCSLWIHASLVEAVPVPVAEGEAEESGLVTAGVPGKDIGATTESAADIGAPADLDLSPGRPHGRRMQFEGVLRPRSFLARSPSKFRLVAYDEDGNVSTVCFVKGNDEQLDALLNRSMIASGRVYWVRRSELPVLVPERIVLKGNQ